MDAQQNIVHIRPTHSYYIEWLASQKQPLSITLVEGSAEILGAELLPNHPHLLRPGDYVTIYTWTGCSLEYSSEGTLPSSEIGTDLSQLHEGSHQENIM